MVDPKDTAVFERHIREALKDGIGQIVEQEIAEANKRVELRVREKFAGFAVQMAKHYEVFTFGGKIVITINDKRESS